MKNQNSALLCGALFVGALGMFSAASCTKRDMTVPAGHVHYSETIDAKLALELTRQGVAVSDSPRYCDAAWQQMREQAAGMDSIVIANIVRDFIATDVCVDYL